MLVCTVYFEKNGAISSIVICIKTEIAYLFENLGFKDVEFLNSESNNDIALIVMSAIKQQTTPTV